MSSSRTPRALSRAAAVASMLLLLLAVPARAEDPVHSRATPTRAHPRGGLLLLSFLIPLPLPLVLVAPPAASRPPVPAAERPAAPPAAAAAPAAPVAKRAGR